jgi:hypothetical protein
MIKVSTWLPVTELEEINKVKGDISVSLFIRRAIQKAIKNDAMMTTLSGKGLPTDSSRAAPVEAAATTTHPEKRPRKEVEVS